MQYRAITPKLGAELEPGTELTSFSDAKIEELKLLAAERGVVVARDQTMDIHAQVDFGRRLGALMETTVNPPEIPNELIIIKAGPKSKSAAGTAWHSDVTSEAVTPGLSMLRMEQVPESGGDTLFADMVQAFEALSPPFQTFLKGLTARHDSRGHYLYRSGAKRLDELPSSNHPVVRTHPLTGRDALYVNAAFVSRINELSRTESDSLLAMLYDHIAYAVRFQCRVRWAPNTVVFWDNRIVQHHAAFDYYPDVRLGYRLTVVGEAPALATAN